MALDKNGRVPGVIGRIVGLVPAVREEIGDAVLQEDEDLDWDEAQGADAADDVQPQEARLVGVVVCEESVEGESILEQSYDDQDCKC